jgi:hypothetical protein
MGTIEPVLEDAAPVNVEDADNAYEDHWYRVLRAAADRAAPVAEGREDAGADLELRDGWLRSQG